MANGMIKSMRISVKGPQGVAIVLALVIGWQLTALIDPWVNPESATLSAPPPGVASPSASRALEERSATIRAAALFGRADEAVTTVPSALGWVLVGIVAAKDDPGAGRAILGETAASTRVYAVGDRLPGERRLHSVYADRVLLERAGVLEELKLPRLTSASDRIPSAAPLVAGPAAEVTGAGGQWADLLRWQAVTRADQPAGLRVYPGPNARLFSRLGLNPGDLLLAINGTPLADPANAEQFLRTLTGTPQATLTLEREGRRENILIDLASLELAGPN